MLKRPKGQLFLVLRMCFYHHVNNSVHEQGFSEIMFSVTVFLSTVPNSLWHEPNYPIHGTIEKDEVI